MWPGGLRLASLATAFIDANVFIYATSASPAVANCQEILELAAASRPHCVTSAEVLQEVFHVLGRRNEPARVADALALAVAAAHVYPLEAEDVLLAATLPASAALSARDRIHCAVMQRREIALLISSDSGFDGLPGITRLDPADLPSWRSLVFA